VVATRGARVKEFDAVQRLRATTEADIVQIGLGLPGSAGRVM